MNCLSERKHVIDVARRKVITAMPEDNLRVVAKMMVDHWISSILIVEKGEPVGIITDGIIFRLIAQGKNPLALLAKNVMVSPVHTIHMDTTLYDAEREFVKSKVSRLAIVDDEGKLVGIVSKKDIDRFAAYSLAERILHHRNEG